MNKLSIKEVVELFYKATNGVIKLDSSSYVLSSTLYNDIAKEFNLDEELNYNRVILTFTEDELITKTLGSRIK